MTIPQLPMVGGIDLGDIGGAVNTIRSIFNPNLGAQTQLRSQLIKDPTLRQKLVDLEYQNPGTIESLFGKQAGFLGQGSPTSEALGEKNKRTLLTSGKTPEQVGGTVAEQAALKETLGEDLIGREQRKASLEATKTGTERSRQIIKKDQPLVDAADLLAKGEIAQAQEVIRQHKENTENSQALDQMLTMYKDRGQLVKAVYENVTEGKPVPLTNVMRRAFFADKGLSREFDAYDTDRTREIAENRANRNTADQIDILNRQQALIDATKFGDAAGIPINGQDLYMIRKQGLGDAIDQFAQNPQAFMQSNPQLGAQIASNPNLVNSWMGYKKGVDVIKSEKDSERALKIRAQLEARHDVLLRDLQTRMGAKGTQRVKNAEEAKALLDNINSYARQIREAGGSQPDFKFKDQTGGFLGSGLFSDKAQLVPVEGKGIAAGNTGQVIDYEGLIRDGITPEQAAGLPGFDINEYNRVKGRQRGKK